jgi:peptidyl-prolyl cis-trans isomerase A (cyclophilin A)
MRIAPGVLLAAALLALTACSSSDEPKKAAPPAEPAKIEHAPAVFRVKLDTTKGPIVVEVHTDWAPYGADHFHTLVKSGFYDGVRFYRVVRNYVAQFGINGVPAVNRVWSSAGLPDDPVKQSNVRGMLTYANSGPSTRTTQLFINMKDNKDLDKSRFAPIGKVIEGMDVVDRLYFLYGDTPPRGSGPDARAIESDGNDYLIAQFPRLDYIRKATVQ